MDEGPVQLRVLRIRIGDVVQLNPVLGKQRHVHERTSRRTIDEGVATQHFAYFDCFLAILASRLTQVAGPMPFGVDTERSGKKFRRKNVQVRDLRPLAGEINLLEEVFVVLEVPSLLVVRFQRFVVFALPVRERIDESVTDSLATETLAQHRNGEPDVTVRRAYSVATPPVFRRVLHVVVEDERVHAADEIEHAFPRNVVRLEDGDLLQRGLWARGCGWGSRCQGVRAKPREPINCTAFPPEKMAPLTLPLSGA